MLNDKYFIKDIYMSYHPMSLYLSRLCRDVFQYPRAVGGSAISKLTQTLKTNKGNWWNKVK